MKCSCTRFPVPASHCCCSCGASAVHQPDAARSWASLQTCRALHFVFDNVKRMLCILPCWIQHSSIFLSTSCAVFTESSITTGGSRRFSGYSWPHQKVSLAIPHLTIQAKLGPAPPQLCRNTTICCRCLILLPKSRKLMEDAGREKSQYSSKWSPLPLGKFHITCYIQ